MGPVGVGRGDTPESGSDLAQGQLSIERGPCTPWLACGGCPCGQCLFCPSSHFTIFACHACGPPCPSRRILSFSTSCPTEPLPLSLSCLSFHAHVSSSPSSVWPVSSANVRAGSAYPMPHSRAPLPTRTADMRTFRRCTGHTLYSAGKKTNKNSKARALTYRVDSQTGPEPI